MAVKLGDVFIALGVDDKLLDRGLEAARGKTQGWLNSFGGVVKTALGGVVLGAATATVGAIAGIGTAALGVSNDTRKAAADMAASLGLPIEEAEKFAEVAKRVYGNNFAENVEDAAGAVTEVTRQLKLAADDPSLQKMTENAIRLRDTFGLDVAESVSQAKTLMDNFGITGEEAFNLIARANQRGLNRSGDLADTINEYSTQFANAGASAEQFFGLLESGAAGGTLGTDKAADAFKEFQLRIQDGSKLTAQSLSAIGLSAEDITAGLSTGALSVADVFTMVQDRLAATTDPVAQFNAGVGLMGTQFEDLGASAALGLDLMSGAFADSAGAIDSLDAKYATFGDAASAVWRRLVVSVTPLTDSLLDMVNNAMPAVLGAFDRFDKTIGPAVANVGKVIENVVNAVKGFFGQFRASVDEDATGPLQYWQEWAATNLPLVQKLFDNILKAIQGFWALFGDDITRIVNNTFGTALTIIDTAMRTIGDVITLALQLITGDWEGAGETLEGIVTRIWEAINTVVSNQLDSLKTLFTSIDWAATGEAIVESVKSGISTGWRALLQWFPDRLSELRNMLPFSEPKDPSSPLRGLAASGESIIGQIQSGMERAALTISPTIAANLVGAGATSTSISHGPVTITQQFYGQTDAAAVRSANDDLLRELRSRGLA